ncbi:DUF692 domain-containing protein [Sorangium sp. So ce887]|uniref:DUF692 domain-containing protein n=1 Tax=Sorangium sp. So ce887 TaxID=3133324 RepID=UPI003F5E7855
MSAPRDAAGDRAPGARSSIPREALGLGLRPPHHEAIERLRPRLGFFEIIAENYLGASPLPRERLRRIAERYPIVAHGVSLNLLGEAPLDRDHLSRLRDLIQELRIPYFTDHLCWTAFEGVTHHDLLPAPCDPELIPYAAGRAFEVQEALGVPFGIENLSSYVAWERDTVPEWVFYRRVVEESGCWAMLDINNVVVSSKNHGFDPREYLDSVPWHRVLQVHLAGHQVLPSGLRHDTHDRPVCDEVWSLYEEAWRRGGPFPTLLEWDAEIPPLSVALSELDKARQVRSS